MKDILLHIDSYPEPTSPEAIEQAVRFVAWSGGALTGLAVQVDVKAPSNRLATSLLNLEALCIELEERSRTACRESLSALRRETERFHVPCETLLSTAPTHAVGEHVAEYAKTRDLCLVPMEDQLDGQRSVAEAVVFGSGRPVLLYRPGVADLPLDGLRVVVLAWDSTRTAARALADSLALLPRAGEVRVLTVLNEKPEARTGAGADVVRHLRAHDVNALADEVDADGRPIGKVLASYSQDQGADLLVMGAYGRSRVREFLLGGATDYMLHSPETPLFLSR